MVKTMTDDDRSTRDKLLDAATAMFMEEGYEAASLARIAESVGLKQGNVYYHFRTKRDLGLAVLSAWNNRTKSFLDSLSGSPKQRLSAFIDWSEAQEDSYFNFGCPIARLTDELRREEPNDEALAQVYATILDWLVEQLQSLGSKISSMCHAEFILSAIQGAIHVGHVTQNRSVYEAARSHIRKFIDGLGR